MTIPPHATRRNRVNHMRRLMNGIEMQKLYSILNNNTNSATRSTARLQRGIGSRKLVRPRYFRFSNGANNGKPAPTQVFGTNLSDPNVANENIENLLAYRTPNETQTITPMTRKNVWLSPNKSKRFANLTQNKNSRKAMINAIQNAKNLNQKTKKNMIQKIYALYTNDF